MGLFGKLFKKTKNANSKTVSGVSQGKADSKAYEPVSLNLEAGKSPKEKVSQELLLKIFEAYFAPNMDFYANPGSPKFTAYFNAVNAAKDEMLKYQDLFVEATRWSTDDLLELLNNPKPAITNMMICSLIFMMGNYSVVKSVVYCADFVEAIPNCVALYFLLIAQRMPEEKRTLIIDAGAGVNKKPLIDAIAALKICDDHWNCKIH